ncbi:hypothetical protein CASFOL_014202 [Castilleja foliolosa]|uniref:DUF4408 domain-containing protein n=1 Tax=Castilleja foliolosa TaxID=1961234 RepID=A0ABD3DP23_9LAMI
MNTWILSMKVLLISAGALALVVLFRFSVPMAVNEIPAIWSFILSWLKPPYLYLVINGIILTIVASTRFHQSKSELPAVVRSEHLISVKTPQQQSFESFSAPTEINTIVEEPVAEEVEAVVELRPVDIGRRNYNNITTPAAAEEILSPEIQSETLFPVREKLLVTSRFGHKKPNRTNPEGVRALRVARAKKHDTLESTWKMITEGRHVPLTRHLKKSDTFEQGHVSPAVDHVAKSETFKERGNYAQPQKIGKEASLGQDELNRRVEAFIKKFNDDMKVQRQESLNQYMEMINRGV